MDQEQVREIEEAQELAEENWLWLQGLLHKVYIGAFIHGYKHRREAENETVYPDTAG